MSLDYWRERYLQHGATYVATGNRAKDYHEQLAGLVPYIAHLPERGRVLDFGCGPGRFRPALEARGLDYEGWDLIPELRTVQTLQPGSFDCAIAIFVLQHIVEEDAYEDAVALLASAVRQGGTLLVVDHEVRPKLAAHMVPRGPGPLVEAGFRRFDRVGAYNNHWIGLFRR